jgi:hypothetical protein
MTSRSPPRRGRRVAGTVTVEDSADAEEDQAA